MKNKQRYINTLMELYQDMCIERRCDVFSETMKHMLSPLSINLTIGSMDSKEFENEITYGTIYGRGLVMSGYRVKIMRDGTIGVLSVSGRYYIRHMYKGKSKPRQCFKWDRIEYYDLHGNYIPLAMAECSNCGDIIQSQYCGHFVSCSCGEISVDTDRWFPERHRIFSKDK